MLSVFESWEWKIFPDRTWNLLIYDNKVFLYRLSYQELMKKRVFYYLKVDAMDMKNLNKSCKSDGRQKESLYTDL